MFRNIILAAKWRMSQRKNKLGAAGCTGKKLCQMRNEGLKSMRHDDIYS